MTSARPLLRAVLLVTLVVLAAVPAGAQPKREDTLQSEQKKLQQTQKRLKEEREKAAEARARETSLLAELEQIERRLAEKQAEVARLDKRIRRAQADIVALRSEIHKKLERGVSRAEAETFHTIGNLKHAAGGGISDEHNLLLAVATRDLDHLAELIHGHTRFAED